MTYLSKLSLVDEYGNEIEGTMLNQLKVAQSYRLCGGVFNGTTLDSNFYTSALSAGGSATISLSELNLATTIASGSSAEYASSSFARYVGANSNQYRAVIRMSAGAANNVRRWGATTGNSPTDGFYFQFTATTFQVVSLLSGTPTAVSSGDFNGDGTATGGTYSLDTNYHIYEIYYTNKRVQFVVDGEIIHTLTATSGQIAATRHFKVYASNINTGVGSALSLYILSATINRLGTLYTQPKTYFQQGTVAAQVLKDGPGSLHALVLSGIVDNAVVTLYDNTAATGTILFTTGAMKVGPSYNVPIPVPFDGGGPMPFVNGLTLAITGAKSNALVSYE